MSGVAIKVLAADALARLKGMEERGGNLIPVNRNFGEYMKGSIDRNFAAQGRPAPWAPLKPQTLRAWGYGYKRGGQYRTKKGYPNKAGRALMANRLILCGRTGHLRRSFFAIPSARSVIMASNDPKLQYHVFGTKFMPVRNPLLFQDEDVSRYEQDLTVFIMTGRIS